MTQNKDFGITAEQEALTALLAHQLFRAPAPASLPEDSGFVLREAEQQSVFPIIYPAAAKLAPKVCAAWKLRNLQHISHNINIINAHFEAHALLTSAEIPYTVIKGCASAFYYPEPELRTMGDVDIYVDRSDMHRVRRVFEENGYFVSGLSHPHHWSFEKDGVVIEAHWVPSGIPAADDGSILSLFDDLLDRCTEQTVAGQSMVLPCAFHHGLIMLLHTANHLTAGGVGLRHLMDWLVFVNGMPEEEFLSCFEDTLRQIGLLEYARVLTAVGVICFSCEPRAFCADVPQQLAMDLLVDILDGGNFGQKNQDRLNQSKLLRDNSTRRIDGKSILGHAVSFLNQRARLQYPAAARNPILLPIGWGKVLRARSRAIRKGKQSRLSLHDTFKGARSREQLYQHLHLFEK